MTQAGSAATGYAPPAGGGGRTCGQRALTHRDGVSALGIVVVLPSGPEYWLQGGRSIFIRWLNCRTFLIVLTRITCAAVFNLRLSFSGFLRTRLHTVINCARCGSGTSGRGAGVTTRGST